ncbi:hypothetical protein L198_07097 [Cryptococcus wingfieldii CBS 7118]|uniref:Rrp15p-domain-containing protein n=1 Tax=Cryptococcus wingfieldii CBS 7118 TaxID=1295528 RepID=A0A1E3IF96_9TREE|nr:hypothetical protein L198_07097 [Cryptococcus wingfieldii CBS 7118]ODN87095.1 hypothetical protein L198_07097 [Cryptococcus wingfieldii CBS 7118]
MPARPLKSALKKPTKSFETPAAGPSKPSFSANKPSQGKPKAKATVSIAKKPEKLRGPDLASDSESNVSGFENESGDEGEVVDEDEEMNTDEEIEKSKEPKKGKKGQKRKRAPTTAADFGATLTSLLADPLTHPSKKAKPAKPAVDPKKKSTTNPILALSAHKPPTKASVSLEAKAKKQIRVDKEEKEDRARVKNVVEGWSGDGVVGGQEFEKNLRKTAQKGVVKLFNAILLASKNAEASDMSLADRAKVKPEAAKRKEKDNILGRGAREDVLTKESFLDMVRKGSSR